jgi:hypothetical protein
MVQRIRLPFIESDLQMGALSAFAYVPIILSRSGLSQNLVGLLDTGASVNVLPYEVGLDLGLTWETQRFTIPWTTDQKAPLILGQTNFFQQFDVCFYRAELAFEISTRPN